MYVNMVGDVAALGVNVTFAVDGVAAATNGNVPEMRATIRSPRSMAGRMRSTIWSRA